MRNDKENLIVQLSLQFAVEIVDYCSILEEHKQFVISRQLLKAGTSIGANISEAQNAESKVDFIHNSNRSSISFQKSSVHQNQNIKAQLSSNPQILKSSNLQIFKL